MGGWRAADGPWLLIMDVRGAYMRPLGGWFAACADYTLSIYHWRKFPYPDPGLPTELLPADWPGYRAAELFFALRARLEPAALEHVRRVCATP